MVTAAVASITGNGSRSRASAEVVRNGPPPRTGNRLCRSAPAASLLVCRSFSRRRWRWRRGGVACQQRRRLSSYSAHCEQTVTSSRWRGMEMALPGPYLLDSGIAIVSIWRQRYTFGQHPVGPFFSRSTTLSQQFKAPLSSGFSCVPWKRVDQSIELEIG